MPSAKLPPVILSDDERATLHAWTRRRRTAQAMAFRARIVLAASTGATNTAIAERLGVVIPTVGKWRRRFLRQRIAGLLDAPRVGAPRKIADADVETAIRTTLESRPKDATHWSTRSLARKRGSSQSTVSRMWRAFGLQPHRVETFKLSTDPQFIEKVRDMVGLYLDAPDRALVLCVVEKSQIQALDRTQPLPPMKPGQVERRTHDYVRHGTVSLFAALEAKTGEIIGRCEARQRSQEFRTFLDQIDRRVPADLDVHLILDNYGTHTTATIRRWLAKRPRFHAHFTPASASWINMVERWFGELTRKQLKRGAHRSTDALEDAIMAYIAHTNKDPKPFVWTKTADEILDSVKRFCQRTSGSAHQALRALAAPDSVISVMRSPRRCAICSVHTRRGAVSADFDRRLCYTASTSSQRMRPCRRHPSGGAPRAYRSWCGASDWRTSAPSSGRRRSPRGRATPGGGPPTRSPCSPRAGCGRAAPRRTRR